MKQIPRTQAKCSGFALAAVAAFAALASGGAPAAPNPVFLSADITLDRFGNLECRSREAKLTPGGQVRYDCASQYVGVMEQCFFKTRPVGNSKLFIFNNVHPEEVINYDIPNTGTVRAAFVTQIPEPGEANALICTAPSEVTVTAVRWCNNTLTDLTNNILGITVPELFDVLVSNGTGVVPSCTDLANGPFTPPGE